MTIAVPIERYVGRAIGILQVQVNLKYVWDLVSKLKVGTEGYAYAVARNGDLIAHPEISLVLQRRNVSPPRSSAFGFPTPNRCGKPDVDRSQESSCPEGF